MTFTRVVHDHDGAWLDFGSPGTRVPLEPGVIVESGGTVVWLAGSKYDYVGVVDDTFTVTEKATGQWLAFDLSRCTIHRIEEVGDTLQMRWGGC